MAGSGTYRKLLDTNSAGKSIYLLTYWYEYYTSSGQLRIDLHQGIEIEAGYEFDTNTVLGKNVTFTFSSADLGVSVTSKTVEITGSDGDTWDEGKDLWTGHTILKTEKFLYGYDDDSDTDLTYYGDGIAICSFITNRPYVIDPNFTVSYQFEYDKDLDGTPQIITGSFGATLTNPTFAAEITGISANISIGSEVGNQAPSFLYVCNADISDTDSLMACITDEDGNIVVDYVSVPMVGRGSGSQFTFFLSNNYESIYNAMPNNNTQTFRMVLRTIISGREYFDTAGFKITVTDSVPSIAPFRFDLRPMEDNTRWSGIFAPDVDKILIGDYYGASWWNYISGGFIKNWGAVYAFISATGNKGAKIVKYEIQNGGQAATYTGEMGFDETTGLPLWCPFPNGVSDPTFTIIITDSRGNTASTSFKTTAWFDYHAVTMDLTFDNKGVNGFDTQATGYYYQSLVKSGSGSNWNPHCLTLVPNEFNLRYRVKLNEEGAEFGDWVVDEWADQVTSFDYPTNYHYWTNGGPTIPVDDYKKSYVIEVEISDLFTSVTKSQTVATEPMFSWSYEDFEFNVPVNINGDLYKNKALVPLPQAGTWEPQCNACNAPTESYGNYLLIGDMCFVSFYYQGEVDIEPSTVGYKLQFYGLPFTPDENIRWQAGGGNCQGYALPAHKVNYDHPSGEKDDHRFMCWNIEGGVIYGRTQCGFSTYDTATTELVTGYSETDYGRAYNYVKPEGSFYITALPGQTLYASGTILYKISADQGGIVG